MRIESSEYAACRVLVEVAFEALPQVILQLLAVLLLPDSPFRAFGRLSVNAIIAISMTITILNLIKTLVVISVEASGLNLSFWQYIKCGALERSHPVPCRYREVHLCTPRKIE